MKNLLIVAHGSRREQSNIETQLLAEKVVAEMPFFFTSGGLCQSDTYFD